MKSDTETIKANIGKQVMVYRTFKPVKKLLKFNRNPYDGRKYQDRGIEHKQSEKVRYFVPDKFIPKLGERCCRHCKDFNNSIRGRCIINFYYIENPDKESCIHFKLSTFRIAYLTGASYRPIGIIDLQPCDDDTYYRRFAFLPRRIKFATVKFSLFGREHLALFSDIELTGE